MDSPRTTELRASIVEGKPFLREIYVEWAKEIARRLPQRAGPIVELGAGGGLVGKLLPEVVTSDVFIVRGVDLVADGRRMPFRDSSLRAIIMTNVLHHIPEVESFLREAERCLRPGGRIIAVEPWNTGWSRLVHERLHHEPFIPEADSWEFSSDGPLSGANAALPWIVVQRDRPRLEAEFQLRVVDVKPFMPFRYLASGGVSMKSLQPRWTYGIWRTVDESRLFAERMALFAVIAIERV